MNVPDSLQAQMLDARERGVRSVQGAKRPDRLNLRTGIMRSLTSNNSRPYRHLGGVALHNRALRIIGERGEHHLPAGVMVSIDSHHGNCAG
jgi:hypothetical protein